MSGQHKPQLWGLGGGGYRMRHSHSTGERSQNPDGLTLGTSIIQVLDTEPTLCLNQEAFVTKRKFVCLMHSVAKQCRERFITGPCKDNRWLMPPKTPKLLEGSQQSIVKGQVRKGCGWLLQTSWCRKSTPHRSGHMFL